MCGPDVSDELTRNPEVDTETPPDLGALGAVIEPDSALTPRGIPSNLAGKVLAISSLQGVDAAWPR